MVRTLGNVFACIFSSVNFGLYMTGIGYFTSLQITPVLNNHSVLFKCQINYQNELTKFHRIVGMLVKTSVCLRGEALQMQGHLNRENVLF